MLTTDAPTFSIVTVCKHAASVIERTLLSVLQQSRPFIEYIVVDGQSTDGTLDVIHAHKNGIAKVISEADEGIYDAMNKGVNAATNDFILFLNAGDYLIHPAAIENVAAKIRRDGLQKVDVLHANLLLYNPSDGSGRLWTSPKQSRLSLYCGSLPHPSTFSSKQAFQKNGLFDKSFRVAGDYEWFVRGFVKNGLSFQHLDVLTTVFLNDGVSTSREWENVQKEEIERLRHMHFSFTERLWLNIGRFLRKNKLLK